MSVDVGLQPPAAHVVPPVALIGFGEVGACLFVAAQAVGEEEAWRVCFPSHAPSGATRAKLELFGARFVDAPSAIAAARLVVSAVTPGAAIDAARSAAPHLPRSATYLDLTSIDADATAEVEAIVTAAGATFAKAVILGPVPILATKTPLAIGGAGAAFAASCLARFGFHDVSVHDDAATPASVKLLWSIVSKGLTALYAEALVPARRLGLEDSLLGLLESQLGFMGSDEMVVRLLMSNVTSGTRRLDEVAAAERTVARTGIEPKTPAATRHWLARLAELAPDLQRETTRDQELLGAKASVAWLAEVLSDDQLGGADGDAMRMGNGGGVGAGT